MTTPQLSETFQQLAFDIIFRGAEKPKRYLLGLVKDLPINPEKASIAAWESQEPVGAKGYKRVPMDPATWEVSEADSTTSNKGTFKNTGLTVHDSSWPQVTYSVMFAESKTGELTVVLWSSLRTARTLVPDDELVVVVPFDTKGGN